jgi:metacaspase-1
MVTLTDNSDPRGPYFPTGHNIVAAMNWLVSEPGCTLFLHYSGHGGQVPDDDSEEGYLDTIVPVDFERMGMIDSGALHRTLVSRLAPGCTLFVLFDCCHR